MSMDSSELVSAILVGESSARLRPRSRASHPKRITVKCGAQLSVQMDQHRAKHWFVVSGLAKVTNGNKIFQLGQDESTFIPVGKAHSLENMRHQLLELIGFQTEMHLGEGDIVRFEVDTAERSP